MACCGARSVQETPIDGAPSTTIDNPIELDVSHIPIYEAADVEIRESPKPLKKSISDSFESIHSLISVDFDFYDELNKITIDKSKSCIKSKSMLPDLINFDAPSTSKFEDYHTMPKTGNTDVDTLSLDSTVYESSYDDSHRSSSRLSLYSKRSMPSLSNIESKTKTEDSYIFEAGYLLNLAARCENTGDYQRAFEYYKSGIEKMLIGVQLDSNQERRAIIKEKTNKYLSYAETIYNNYLCDAEQSVLPEQEESRRTHWPLPLSMVRRATDELACYRVLGVLAPATMLVLHDGDQTCYAMKVVQKIPNNLTEFDDFFLQRISETRQPVLPTVIPYMVPLHALIETNHLYFLILSYAPGKKLFEYIKNYANSIPNTPARQVNLENVFSEPIAKKNDIENNITEDIEANLKVNTDYLDSVNKNVDKLDNVEVSVNELVMNSQKLLLNVDRVLSEVGGSGVGLGVAERDGDSGQSEREDTERVNTLGCRRLTPNPRDLLPPSAVCKWGAEILTALESLHNCGVVCRDLNPSNILLGDRGQIILTYFLYYPGVDMALAMIHRHTDTPDMYIAPELYTTTCVEGDGALDRVCDFWSFGAVMYELLCGVPLSHYHRSVFTSHTILQLPDGLPVEVQSLLTQLLTYEPAERLGAGKTGIAEIKQHPYFKHIDWQQVYDAWIAPA
ncbi:ribosomal protein S6 kinase-like 1 isoform X2 [Epargyreus clarus]|uniref:ribosomal protein S6 kinase-like 1 isoform X2 n=1 Tax=Epargyreus clarus TaxID=520877 RepID=UPI003C2EA6C9